MSYTLDFPIQYIANPDRFATIGLGEMYIGVVDGDPAFEPADRIQVYIARQNDTDLAIPQPIELSAGGVPVYLGSPVTLKINQSFSVAVLDKNGQQVYYSPKSGEIIDEINELDVRVDSLESNEIINVDTYADIAATPLDIGQVIYLKQHTSGGFGGGTFMGVSSAGLTPDGGTVSATETPGVYAKRVNYSRLDISFWGAVSGAINNSPAIQAAVNSAGGFPLYEGNGGTFKCTSTILFDTAGDGNVEGLKIIGSGKYKTIFDNATGGPLFSLTSGSSTSDFQFNSQLKEFSIINSTNSLNTKGILLKGIFDSGISNVYIENQASHSIHLFSDVGDATDCYNIDMNGIKILNGGGVGIYSEAPSAINAGLKVSNSSVVLCDGGGILFESTVNSKITNTSIAYNSTFGIKIGASTGPFSKEIEVNNCEFDSNQNAQLMFDKCLGGQDIQNYYVVNNSSGSVPVVTKQLYITSNAQHIYSNQALPRIPISYTGVTQFTVDSGATFVEIRDTIWAQWQSAGNTKYMDASTGTIILDEGIYTTPVNAVGFKFPAIRVPSGDANTIDFYSKPAAWTTTFSNLVNITGTPTLLEAYFSQIGDWVFVQGQINLTATSTGAVSLSLLLPIPTELNISSAVGQAVEVNQVAMGVVYDTSGADNNVCNVAFSSLNSGARNVKFSLTYATS